MSYYVTILTCNLHYTNKNHPDLDQEDYYYPWFSEGKDVFLDDYSIKWSDELLNDFLRMIREGIEGSVEMQCEEDELSMFKLSKKGVEEFFGHTSYSKEPDVIHTLKR